MKFNITILRNRVHKESNNFYKMLMNYEVYNTKLPLYLNIPQRLTILHHHGNAPQENYMGI